MFCVKRKKIVRLPIRDIFAHQNINRYNKDRRSYKKHYFNVQNTLELCSFTVSFLKINNQVNISEPIAPKNYFMQRAQKHFFIFFILLETGLAFLRKCNKIYIKN